MTDYTPTTDEVRINTVADLTSSHPLYAERLAQFDRWLTAHNRKIAAKALRDAADAATTPTNTRAWLHARADRIEQGGES